jgi:hypothetical protein
MPETTNIINVDPISYRTVKYNIAPAGIEKLHFRWQGDQEYRQVGLEYQPTDDYGELELLPKNRLVIVETFDSGEARRIVFVCKTDDQAAALSNYLRGFLNGGR